MAISGLKQKVSKLRDKGWTFERIGLKLRTSRQYAHLLCPGKSSTRVAYTIINNRWHHCRLTAAKRRGISFRLTRTEFAKIISSRCVYGGASATDGIRIGIDRKNNAKGYVPGNCDPCCDFHNRMRSNIFSQSDMKAVLRLLPRLAACGNRNAGTKEQYARGSDQ